MKAKIAVVEDIAEMAQLITLYMNNEGWETVRFETAEAALDYLEHQAVHLVLLDVNLPGMDGFDFLAKFRKRHNCPVLIVSARSSDEDIITGLGYGADEFVNKPFSPRVLVARVRALLRRAEGLPDTHSNLVSFGPFSLDRDACLLKKEGGRIALSAKEFGVLDFLYSQEGKPSTPEAIYRHVWKNEFGDVTTVAVYIQRLRKKMENDPASPQYLETVFGMGYRLKR